jgi:hypothetical protein
MNMLDSRFSPSLLRNVTVWISYGTLNYLEVIQSKGYDGKVPLQYIDSQRRLTSGESKNQT